jgi:hypothetical protein
MIDKFHAYQLFTISSIKMPINFQVPLKLAIFEKHFHRLCQKNLGYNSKTFLVMFLQRNYMRKVWIA